MTNNRKRALITGITGQDGSYLAELLLAKDYEVHGIIRRASTFNTKRIQHLFCDPHEEDVRLFLHYGDLGDGIVIRRLIEKIAPDEVYNLGAQSHVKVSFDIPENTCDVVAMGAVRMLEAIRDTGIQTKYYQASSSEMFGDAQEIPQRETTPFHPRSPYAAAKVMAYWVTVCYRESFDMFCCNGILFNHESPRRGETFVTRKITRGIANILAGNQTKIYLGTLDAKRDWGYAPYYVWGMWLMLQQSEPDNYLLATGETKSVREFLKECCELVGLDMEQVYEIDPRYLRPSEVNLLCGDASKAQRKLGWNPGVTFKSLVKIMMAYDIQEVGLDPKDYGLEKYDDKNWINRIEDLKNE
jgi:GDPmannose 4,6-dehydratase